MSEDKKSDLTSLENFASFTGSEPGAIEPEPMVQDLENLDQITLAPAEEQLQEGEIKIQTQSIAPHSDAFASSVESSPPPSGEKVLSQIKNYSESIPLGKPVVPAAFPFNLRITGKLTQHEKDRLSELISRENIGIREVDLEPQFESGRVFIPRISEFAGVLLVQALRGAAAEIELLPLDLSDETQMNARGFGSTGIEIEQNISEPGPGILSSSSDLSHPAESIPVVPDAVIPGMEMELIDAVTATAALKTTVVEAERSTEYQELLEGLQRELRYKTYRKGGQACVSFSVTLSQLGLPTHYRITAVGTAARMTPKQTGRSH